jgi:hypothetical protein
MIGTAWRWSASKPSIKVMPVSGITASDLARMDRLNFRIGSLRRRARRGGKHGQAMIEFTLVLPFLLFVLFGVFEFGLMMFSLGASRFASADAARVVSEQGTLVINPCSSVPGCSSLDRPTWPLSGDCDADCQALSAINLGPLGTTSIATIDEIDVARLTVNGSAVDTSLADGTSCSGPCVNKYTLDGRRIGSAKYSPTSRGVTLGTTDYAAITVKFRYKWKTGIFSSAFPVVGLSSTFNVKLEPQKFP